MKGPLGCPPLLIFGAAAMQFLYRCKNSPFLVGQHPLEGGARCGLGGGDTFFNFLVEGNYGDRKLVPSEHLSNDAGLPKSRLQHISGRLGLKHLQSTSYVNLLTIYL